MSAAAILDAGRSPWLGTGIGAVFGQVEADKNGGNPFSQRTSEIPYSVGKRAKKKE